MHFDLKSIRDNFFTSLRLNIIPVFRNSHIQNFFNFIRDLILRSLAFVILLEAIK